MMLLAGIGTSVESCFKESSPPYNTNSLIHHDPFMLAYFLLANRCKINCGNKVAANKKMVIESTCKGLSCKSGQRYNWTLYMRDPMAYNETWLPVIDFKEKTLTELDSPNIVIKGGFHFDEAQVGVT